MIYSYAIAKPNILNVMRSEPSVYSLTLCSALMDLPRVWKGKKTTWNEDEHLAGDVVTDPQEVLVR